MYMSYCRFEGTNAELGACLTDVEEHIYEEAEYEISDHEIDHFKRMVENFVSFLDQHELLDEYGELDEDKLDAICESMKRANSEY